MMETKVDVYIPLGRGKVAVIDFDDFEKIRGTKWCADEGRRDTWYARRSRRKGQKAVSLHRVLLDVKPGEVVDHKDRDGLNNRRDNLRIVTASQNAQNMIKQKGTSQFKGVYRSGRPSRWKAQIWANGAKVHLGYFHNEQDAARAYDAAALKHFGEYARINFPAQKESQCQSSINAGGAA